MEVDSKAQRSGFLTIWVSVAGNAILIALKLFLGVIGRSQALIADAVHTVTDFITDFMAFAGLRYALKARDREHPFGHGKIETLMSLLIGVILLIAGMWIGYSALLTLFTGRVEAPNVWALAGALISIVVKEGLYQYTAIIGRKIRSQVLIANAWHHRSDAISSVAVVIGVGGALINPAWKSLDAFAALIVCIFIIKVGFDIVIPAFRSAADEAPDQKRLEEIKQVAEEVEGVRNAHDIRARFYANKLYVEVHVVVDPDISVAKGHEIAIEVRQRIRRTVSDILDLIVHVDPDEGEAASPEL